MNTNLFRQANGNSTRYSVFCRVALIVLCCSLTAVAQDTGHIFTTTATGTAVDANLYPSKADVYLTGGPNSCRSKSGLSAGDYYFQVTTPNNIVLSEDAISNRQFHVNSDGYVDTYSGTHAFFVLEVCPGKTSLAIQLIPYANTTNPGGEYKVWACQGASCQQISTVSVDGNDNPTAPLVSGAFPDNSSKTDNFKVKPTTPPQTIIWPIAGVKFYDAAGSGVLSASVVNNVYTLANPIPHFKFQIFSACAGLSTPTVLGGGCLVLPDNSGAPYTTTTDADGKFRFDGLTAGDTYGICEVFPTANPGTAWRATSACPNSETGAYSLGSNLYGVPYPTTYDGPTNHLGLGDAMCNNPSTLNPNPSAFFANISDVFEWGVPGANFGNSCRFIAGGGLTLGFWSNNNGNYLIGANGGVSLLNSLKDQAGNALHIIDNTGAAVTFGSLPCTSPTSNSKFDCWLTKSSNSSDSANQLAVQMVAADLNVVLGAKAVAGGCGSTHVNPCENTAASYAEAAWGGPTAKYPNFTSQCGIDGGNGGWTTLGCLINEANAAIALNTNPSSTATCTVTFGTHSLGTQNCRVYQTGIQNLLNLANNNDTTAQPVDDATGTALCGVNYTGSESCSVTVPLAPPSPFTFPLAPPLL